MKAFVSVYWIILYKGREKIMINEKVKSFFFAFDDEVSS